MTTYTDQGLAGKKRDSSAFFHCSSTPGTLDAEQWLEILIQQPDCGQCTPEIYAETSLRRYSHFSMILGHIEYP